MPWHDHAMLGRRGMDVIPGREVLDISVTRNCMWLEGRSWFSHKQDLLVPSQGWF